MSIANNPYQQQQDFSTSIEFSQGKIASTSAKSELTNTVNPSTSTPSLTISVNSGARILETDPVSRLPEVISNSNPAVLERRSKFCSPLAEHSIASLDQIVSDPFHPPPMGKDDRHQGVDFAYYNDGIRSSVAGEGITAVLSGTVVVVQDDRLPYGNMVIIETPYAMLMKDVQELYEVGENMSLYHLYAHMENIAIVTKGDKVQCGQLLGTVGKTGYNIVNPHLHIEFRIGFSGAQFETMAFYDPYSSDSERTMYETWRMSGEFIPVDPMAMFQLKIDTAR